MAISAPPALTAPPATRSAETVTDAELVAAVRDGSERAFEQLYERYHRRIAAYIYGMVSDYGRAEDISQDVFMSALRRMRATDRPIAFKPWVYEIAKNACIDQFRRARRGEEISYDAEDGLAAAERSRLTADAPSSAAQVDQKVAIDNLRGAFGGLSRTHHEILVLREFEGLSYQQIGERLGMSRASVESTLFRARRRLTEEYEELVSGERCRRVQGLIDAAVGTVPGARDQRRLSAHLSHCQPCRRGARQAGLAEAFFAAPRGVRAKVAAFIPLPAFLQRRWGADPSAPVAAPAPSLSTLAQLSAQYGGNLDPAFASWARAAVAAAAVALAGAAGGAAVSDESREYFGGERPARSAPPPPSTIGTAGPRPAARSATSAPTPTIRTKGTASISGLGRERTRPTAATEQTAKRSTGNRARGPAPAAATVTPAGPVPGPDTSLGGQAPAVPAPPAAAGAAVGGIKEAGEKAAAETFKAAGSVTSVGGGVVQGITETGRSATGDALPPVPPVPALPPAPGLPPALALPPVPPVQAVPVAPGTAGR